MGTWQASKVTVSINWSRFTIKTVDNESELQRALQLRHEVFIRELLGRSNNDGLDHDDFDEICDHLIIIDNPSQDIVGTYRFISSQWSQRFYTQTEFQLDDLLTRPTRKLEMGRACIHPNFRSGFTFIALWKGLAAYIHKHPVDILFGCSSAKAKDAHSIAAMVDYLQRHHHYSTYYHCQPHPGYHYPGLAEALSERAKTAHGDDTAIKKTLPPLLVAYIDAGAKVVGLPAWDADFACVDFLTVLETGHLRDDLVRKYKPW